MKEAVHISGLASAGPDLQELLGMVARGDQDAFSQVYEAVCGPVLGLVRSVLRDPAQSEEVAQEVLVEVWRTAPRFQAARGSAMNWVLTLAHHRAVDRVRSVEATTAREHKAALLDRTPRSTTSPNRWRPGWSGSRSAAACGRSPNCNGSPSPWRTTGG